MHCQVSAFVHTYLRTKVFHFGDSDMADLCSFCCIIFMIMMLVVEEVDVD